MNIMTLIEQHPQLFADLKYVGLSTSSVKKIATAISTQLGGRAESNLEYIVAALNRMEFIASIDAAEIAQRTRISLAIVQSAVFTLAPWVDKFQLHNELE